MSLPFLLVALVDKASLFPSCTCVDFAPRHLMVFVLRSGSVLPDHGIFLSVKILICDNQVTSQPSTG